MPSLIPGYEYDIFISYRHNDNRSGWVTDFVKALQEELAATIKEPLSVYFDSNPHDGLLETHDVDGSLKEKIKCLVFIPIVSQTYCDPNSFAWKSEFLAFIDFAKSDQQGLDVKLSNGNIAKRVLPIRIHEIDGTDKKLFEEIIRGVIRPIDFIYKEPGVNRPLTLSDIKNDNQSKTNYRNQINKVANSIKEIFKGMTTTPIPIIKTQSIKIETHPEKKSIVVLPFINMSNDTEQEYFSDGLTEEIITDLSFIKGLMVISRSSAMTFKNTVKKVSEIANDLSVKYVLEGSVRKSGNSLRITAQLIDAASDSHIWANKYSGELEDVFELQEKISRNIVDSLKVELTKEESLKISERPFKNPATYELSQRAMYELYFTTENRLMRALDYLDEAMKIEGENTALLTRRGFIYCNLFNAGSSVEMDKQYLDQARGCAKRILQLEGESAQWHGVNGLLSFYEGHITEAMRHIRQAFKLNPNNDDLTWLIILGHLYLGMTEEAAEAVERMGKRDPLNPVFHALSALTSYYSGNITKSMDLISDAYQKFKEVPQVQLYYAYFNLIKKENELTNQVTREMVANFPDTMFSTIGNLLISVMSKDRDEVFEVEGKVADKLKMDAEWSWLLADFYSFGGHIEKSLDWLEYAVDHGFVNYPLLAIHDPFLTNVRGQSRFNTILEKARKASDLAIREFRAQ